ncbi:hypothetical protein EVAR_95003_1 [Eumeta japonica]|uniref:Uncharacterized protein n=1 Tax=Eumeta variegata TaxID=151549 RepID=A0A4C1UUP3_EUMVA|nr:hypothetical protein EVAR_95003_1 [Eumeta japonica]
MYNYLFSRFKDTPNKQADRQNTDVNFPILSQEAGDVLMTRLAFRVSMGGVDRLPLDYAIKEIYCRRVYRALRLFGRTFCLWVRSILDTPVLSAKMMFTTLVEFLETIVEMFMNNAVWAGARARCQARARPLIAYVCQGTAFNEPTWMLRISHVNTY